MTDTPDATSATAAAPAPAPAPAAVESPTRAGAAAVASSGHSRSGKPDLQLPSEKPEEANANGLVSGSVMTPGVENGSDGSDGEGIDTVATLQADGHTSTADAAAATAASAAAYPRSRPSIRSAPASPAHRVNPWSKAQQSGADWSGPTTAASLSHRTVLERELPGLVSGNATPAASHLQIMEALEDPLGRSYLAQFLFDMSTGREHYGVGSGAPKLTAGGATAMAVLLDAALAATEKQADLDTAKRFWTLLSVVTNDHLRRVLMKHPLWETVGFWVSVSEDRVAAERRRLELTQTVLTNDFDEATPAPVGVVRPVVTDLVHQMHTACVPLACITTYVDEMNAAHPGLDVDLRDVLSSRRAGSADAAAAGSSAAASQGAPRSTANSSPMRMDKSRRGARRRGGLGIATAPQRHSFIMRTPRLLPQEHLLWKLGAVLQSTSQPVAGALYLTNFQLIFSPFRSVGIHTASLLQSDQPDASGELRVPLPYIARVDTPALGRSSAETQTGIEVVLKDFAVLAFLISASDIAEDRLVPFLELLPHYSTGHYAYERVNGHRFATNPSAPYTCPQPRAYAFRVRPSARHAALSASRGVSAAGGGGGGGGAGGGAGAGATATSGAVGGGDEEVPEEAEEDVEEDVEAGSDTVGAVTSMPAALDGWQWYSAEREFERQGVVSRRAAWRVSTANGQFKLCDTYPSYLVVPTGISDVELQAIARFRSKQRIPAVTWFDAASGGALLRCAQPRVGITHNRCAEDQEYMVKAHVKWIWDARPRKNALGNRAMGKGYELAGDYSSSRLEFLDIENIHVMRESNARLAEVLAAHYKGGGGGASSGGADHKSSKQVSGKGAGTALGASDSNWWSSVESTKWLKHCQAVIRGSLRVAQAVHKGETCLVHCSDGWDRTAQVSALAQLFMDPYYRTLRGFVVLVEKDWCSFGFMFHRRLGHGSLQSGEDQRSPIFLQWLDCVWQVWRQYPLSFEFNENFLATVAHHSYSCRFGTFLYNCERHRRQAFLATRTESLWTYVARAGSSMLNPHYRSRAGVLRPSARLCNLRLWPYHYRWYPDLQPAERIPSAVASERGTTPTASDKDATVEVRRLRAKCAELERELAAAKAAQVTARDSHNNG